MKISLFVIILSTTTILVCNPQNDENYFFLGEYYILQEDYEKAEESYLLALKEDPGSVEIFNSLIDLSLQLKDYEKALTYTLQAIDFAPLDYELIDKAINLYIFLDQKDSAYQFINKKVQNYPEDTNLLMRKLTVLVSLFNWKETIETCIDILLIEPENQEIYQTMLEIGFQTEEFDLLLTGFDKLINKFPDEKVFAVSYIRILYLVGNQTQVLEELKVLNKKYPQNDIFLNQLAQQLNDMGNYLQSDSLYLSMVMSEDPDISATAMNNYAYNLCTRENSNKSTLKTALDYSSMAIEKSPNNPSFLDTAGWIYFKLREYELAEHFLLISLEIDNKNSVIYEHLSDVYTKTNQKTKALDALNKAISLDQNNENLKEKRTLLLND